MKRILPCILCGDDVELPKSKYAEYVRQRRLPVCRRNGCYLFVGYSSKIVERDEWRRAGLEPEAARKLEGPLCPEVVTMRFEPGSGKRGHDAAPLANGRVRRRRRKGFGRQGRDG